MSPYVGVVYKGINLARGQDVAIKVESYAAEDQQLEYEYQVYRKLACDVGIPKVHWMGAECGYNVMVLDLLGPSLEDLFNFCQRHFSLKTVLMLADQMVGPIGCCL